MQRAMQASSRRKLLAQIAVWKENAKSGNWAEQKGQEEEVGDTKAEI